MGVLRRQADPGGWHLLAPGPGPWAAAEGVLYGGLQTGMTGEGEDAWYDQYSVDPSWVTGDFWGGFAKCLHNKKPVTLAESATGPGTFPVSLESWNLELAPVEWGDVEGTLGDLSIYQIRQGPHGGEDTGDPAGWVATSGSGLIEAQLQVLLLGQEPPTGYSRWQTALEVDGEAMAWYLTLVEDDDKEPLITTLSGLTAGAGLQAYSLVWSQAESS